MGLADTIRIMLGNLTPEEIAERDAAARLRREQAEQSAAPPVDLQDNDEYRRYAHRLELAAGISSVQLQCHRDIWRFLNTWMGYGRHPGGFWSLSGPDDWWKSSYRNRVRELEEDMLDISLSGVHVAEVIARLALACEMPGAYRPMYVPTPTITARALARRLYDAIGAVVDQVQPDSTTRADLPPIVLDDRPSAEQPDQQIQP